MPQWLTEEDSDEELDQILKDLEEEVSSDPSFEEVVGMSTTRLMNHSTQAVLLLTRIADLKSASGLVQLYMMGFIVGLKYARAHPTT